MAIAAMAPESLEPATDLPRGAMVCLDCGVSWSGFQARACWCCGHPGRTTSQAVVHIQREADTMAGTLTVNVKQTFATMILLSAAEKTKFGTSEPDVTKAGEKKYAIECAVTYLAENGMRPVSEVISVGLIGGDLPTIAPGTPVEWDSLRAGVMAPERRENGKGISGGKLWWQGSGLRPASQTYQRPAKPAETAA